MVFNRSIYVQKRLKRYPYDRARTCDNDKERRNGILGLGVFEVNRGMCGGGAYYYDLPRRELLVACFRGAGRTHDIGEMENELILQVELRILLSMPSIFPPGIIPTNMVDSAC